MVLNMTSVFKYDFSPTRAPPAGLAVLNLPGSFGPAFDSLAYSSGQLVSWAADNWVDVLTLAFAAYGFAIAAPRIFSFVGVQVGKLGRLLKR
jgi:hypothetical protein